MPITPNSSRHGPKAFPATYITPPPPPLFSSSSFCSPASIVKSKSCIIISCLFFLSPFAIHLPEPGAPTNNTTPTNTHTKRIKKPKYFSFIYFLHSSSIAGRFDINNTVSCLLISRSFINRSRNQNEGRPSLISQPNHHLSSSVTDPTMAGIQLSFTLRTSPNCKTVHLLGSWDGYQGQVPLSKDSSKNGGWKGTFRFQPTMLKQGQRYWYYVSDSHINHIPVPTLTCSIQYIIDSHHVSHDPAQPSTREPTTGRQLNILDVPPSSKPSLTRAPLTQPTSTRHSRHLSKDIPKGRALSPSQIQSPYPGKPYATRHLITTDYGSHPTVAALTRQFAGTRVADSDSDSDIDTDSDVPSLAYSTSTRSPGGASSGSSRTSSSNGSAASTRFASPTSSISSNSSCCTCERFGITRKGDRVRLDCGGSRCGYSDGGEEGSCSSEEEEAAYRRQAATRRQGVVVKPSLKGRR